MNIHPVYAKLISSFDLDIKNPFRIIIRLVAFYNYSERDFFNVKAILTPIHKTCGFIQHINKKFSTSSFIDENVENSLLKSYS